MHVSKLDATSKVRNRSDLHREYPFLLVKHMHTCQIDYWLHSLQARVPGVPIVIVGTHVDQFYKIIKRTSKRKIKEGTTATPSCIFLIFTEFPN